MLEDPHAVGFRDRLERLQPIGVGRRGMPEQRQGPVQLERGLAVLQRVNGGGDAHGEMAFDQTVYASVTRWQRERKTIAGVVAKHTFPRHGAGGDGNGRRSVGARSGQTCVPPARGRGGRERAAKRGRRSGQTRVPPARGRGGVPQPFLAPSGPVPVGETFGHYRNELPHSQILRSASAPCDGGG